MTRDGRNQPLLLQCGREGMSLSKTREEHTISKDKKSLSWRQKLAKIRVNEFKTEKDCDSALELHFLVLRKVALE